LLKPNECFSYEGDGDLVLPMVDQSQRMWSMAILTDSDWSGVEFSTSPIHWNVTIPKIEPIVPGSWKEEGF
jgi:hypothetical protein